MTSRPREHAERSIRRPIYGFGRGGAVAAVVLAALICGVASGRDLRETLFQAVYEAFDIAAVYTFLLWWIIPHGFALWYPLFGPLCLLYVLPALHLAPGRRPWWVWAVVLVAAIVTPPLWYWLAAASRLRGTFPPWVFGGDWLGFVAVLDLGTVAGLWWVTRSWRLAAVAGAASLACCQIAGGPWATEPFNKGVACCWQAIMAAALLTWAIRARLRRAPVGLCAECGYDLSGLVSGVCPECGAAKS